MDWLSRALRRLKRLFLSNGGSCEHAIHLRQGTAEFELFVAKGELEIRHDLAHGMKHMADLLSYDPGRPEWLELLHAYFAAAGDNPESLLPAGKERYYAQEAVRAYLFARQGRLVEAVDLLVAVVEAKPDSGYLEAWGLGWLEPPGAFESLPWQTAARLLAGALLRFPEFPMLTARQRGHLLRYVKLAERYRCHFPRSEMSDMAHAGLLRKAGLFAEALAFVREAAQARPGWHLATAEGLILRESGQCEAAEAAFRKALEFDPSDLSARLETGDMYFNCGLWERAAIWYQQVLQKEPQHPWALPSMLFCRWKMESESEFPDDKFPEALVDLARHDPPNGRAHDLCMRFSRYTGYLPEPADATANILRQVIESMRDKPPEPGGEVSITVSCLEAPSNVLAFRLQMEAMGRDSALTVQVQQVPRPDPRQPIEPVEFLLWQYEGTDPRPALPVPPDDVRQAIAEAALEPYDGPRDWARASRVAERLGASRAAEILAVMVHPPAVPPGRTALAWVPRVQLVAALVLAHLDDGWEGSVRRRALYSVLLGPRDWTTTAAILALARLASEQPAIAQDVHEAFLKLAKARPQPGFCCYEHALYWNWRMLPHLFAKEREEMGKRLEQIEAE